jgi:hypothetical protein
MAKRQLTTIGLLVYATILVTSFLHVLEAFLAYSHPVTLGSLVIPAWVSGVGVALGLDLSILYFSYLSVILPGSGAHTAKQASRAATLLVWFAVLYSMVWGHVAAGRWLEAGVGALLSLFVPLTSLRVGQLLAEITRMPLERTNEATAPEQTIPYRDGQSPYTEGPGLAAAQMVKVETHIHTAGMGEGGAPQDSVPLYAEPTIPYRDSVPLYTEQTIPSRDRQRLTPAERAVLQVIEQRGYVRLVDLMGELGTGLNRIGEVCGTLEARGLIRRRDGGWEAA